MKLGIGNWELGIRTLARTVGADFRVALRVPDDRADDRDEFVRFLAEQPDLACGPDTASLEDLQSHVRLARFLETNGTLWDEVSRAFGGARFFQHGSQRRRTVQQLRRENSPYAATFVEGVTKPNDAAGEFKRAIANVLTVFMGGMGLMHGPANSIADAIHQAGVR
jgi:hypothetical protein